MKGQQQQHFKISAKNFKQKLFFFFYLAVKPFENQVIKLQ